MRNIEYAYKILGINPMSIERNADGKRRTEEEKLIFLRGRKEHRIHVLENKMQLSGISDEVIQKYNEEIVKIEKAYNELINDIQIGTIGYSNEKHDRFEAIYNKINGIPEDAYSVFGIARDICEKRDCEGNCIELDEAIKKRLEGLMELADKTKTLDFREKQKNQLRKKQIRDAYELIKNSSKRKEYNKSLDVQKEKRKERGREGREGRKEGRKAVLTGFGKGKPSSEKAPFPSVTPPLSRPVHENQPVCPASGSASNSNNWPSVFLPNATFALLMMRQGTLMILYRSRSSGKWFTS